MDSKPVRYLFVLLLAALVTFTLTGCGGGETTDLESAAEAQAGLETSARPPGRAIRAQHGAGRPRHSAPGK